MKAKIATKTPPPGSLKRVVRPRGVHKGKSKRYQMGDVQRVPEEWQTNAVTRGGWFWIQDRKHPKMKRILCPMAWAHWLTKRLNAYDTWKRSNDQAERQP